ncbi:hypothetical protein Hdeb2414_s0260g00850891 [Helianthus debilis subsp. tardiflorus]
MCSQRYIFTPTFLSLCVCIHFPHTTTHSCETQVVNVTDPLVLPSLTIYGRRQSPYHDISSETPSRLAHLQPLSSAIRARRRRSAPARAIYPLQLARVGLTRVHARSPATRACRTRSAIPCNSRMLEPMRLRATTARHHGRHLSASRVNQPLATPASTVLRTTTYHLRHQQRAHQSPAQPCAQ